jgi:septum formation protein
LNAGVEGRQVRTPSPGRLVLASTSRYRRELLQRLGLPFEVAAPAVDETPHPGELPAATATRLAQAKAEALAGIHADAWVLGSDQVATLDQRTLGKPGGHDAALAQLMAMSGRSVEFLTAVCLAGAGGQRFSALDVTTVRFRELRGIEVRRYLEAEEPYDCAGSFKAEGLGIALFESIRSDDPTGLIGLPLIATARLLRQAGFAVP